MKTRYRIVKDEWLGYEVQSWRWWFPFWIQVGFTNTHQTPEDAEKWLSKYKERTLRFVKYIN